MRFRPHTSHYPALIRLALPILVSQLGVIVVGFADNIMVGRYSTDALASASFVNNIFNLAIFASMGFSLGFTPIAGALFRHGREVEIGGGLRDAVILNVLFGVFLTLAMGGVYLCLPLLGQPEELLPLIRPYFLIYLAGVIPVAVFNVFAQWSYAITNSRMPMWIILSANLVNIIGNYVLIYGHWGAPEMGLLGAGASTLAARLISAAAIVAIFLRQRRYAAYREGFKTRKKEPGRSRKILSTSFPVALQMVLETSSFSLAAVMAGWINAPSLAAYQIIVITGTLGFCIYYSLGSAIAVYVANACGVPDMRLARTVASAGYELMLMLMLTSSCILGVWGKDIMHVFTDDPAVLAITSTLIVPLLLYQLADATQITFANALRGTSKVMPMMWIAFVSYLVIGIPATYILAFPAGLGVYGIVLSFSVSLISAAVLFVLFFRRATSK